jgi:hypothetical protein
VTPLPVGASAPIVALSFHGDDGSGGFLGLRDTVGGFGCAFGAEWFGPPFATPIDDGMHCFPSELPTAQQAYSDAACTTLVTYAGPACTTPVALGSERTRLFALGDAVSTDGYVVSVAAPQPCIPAPKIDGRRVTTTAATLGALPPFTAGGGRRLRARGFTLADGTTVATAIYDSTLGEECTFRHTSAGFFCLPSDRHEAFNIDVELAYADAACTEILVPIFWPKKRGWVAETDRDGLVTTMYRIGDDYVGPVYGTDSRGCEAVTGPAQKQWRASVVDLHSFALGDEH